MNADSEYWKPFFEQLHGRHELDSAHRVGMSNERVTAQEYALMLEAAGPLGGRSTLDAGCGLGDLARLAAAGGAASTGVDYVATTVAELRQRFPALEWLAEDLTAPSATFRTRRFDVVFACEVLQHVPVETVLPGLWAILPAGGRFVGMVPNADCEIVSRTRQRFAGKSHATDPQGLAARAGPLPEVAGGWYRELAFRAEQTLSPYTVGAWRELRPGAAPVAGNRIQFVLLKGS